MKMNSAPNPGDADVNIHSIQNQAMSSAQQLAAALKASRRRIVFAESCTAGLVSALLAETPGISEWHCGSSVVYRVETKACWLGIERPLLEVPGPVSPEVARAMVEGVLAKTPEADVALSVTGHLGPNAPATQDGLIYIGQSVRDRDSSATEVWLPKNLNRVERQYLAAFHVLTAAGRLVAS